MAHLELATKARSYYKDLPNGALHLSSPQQRFHYTLDLLLVTTNSPYT